MNYYRRLPMEAIGVINRCYFEADHGRVSLALERLHDLDAELPNNAHIAYAAGQIRRDYLGEAATARKLFERAYELAASQRLRTETAWFAICNMVQLAESPEEYRKWTQIALAEKGPRQQECRQFRRVLDELELSLPLFHYQADAANEALRSGAAGTAAALAETALQAATDLSREEELELRTFRCNSLRQLDAKASHRYEARGEHFPPEDRVALHGAVEELDRAVGLDKYEATLWNYRSAWCHLLGRYQECIDAADEAIRLRPHRYPRPYINKAQSLWALGRDQHALACAEEALRQTEGSGLPPDTVVQSRALIAMYSAGRPTPTLELLMPPIGRLVNSIQKISNEEFAQVARGRVTPETVKARVLGHLITVQDNPTKGYVPMVAELLASFTPETVACVTANLRAVNRDVADYCAAAAIYVAAHAEGAHQRDAARYLCLTTLLAGDAPAIKRCYRRRFLAVSAAATDEIAWIGRRVSVAFGRINPLLPELLDQQEPITEDERQHAASGILAHFAGPPPEAGIDIGVGSGCASQAIKLILSGVGLIMTLLWLTSTVWP